MREGSPIGSHGRIDHLNDGTLARFVEFRLSGPGWRRGMLCALVPWIFSLLILLPAARLDDGLLDVGILAPAGPVGWARVAARVLARSTYEDRQLERFRRPRGGPGGLGNLGHRGGGWHRR